MQLLTAPAQNQNFAAPANITLTAVPSAGSPQSVEFLQGNTVIHTSTSAPYTFTWASLPPGSYSFTARATDAGGGATTSTAIHVTVGTAGQQAQLYFIHPDHLNTPRVITNNAQQVVWRWDNTDPFGANAPNENPSGLGGFTCNLRLPGQYFDRETNLHYNYFRDYDPSTGRYVQSDPIGLEGGLNTYAYVGGNPISLSDPLGLRPVGTIPDDPNQPAIFYNLPRPKKSCVCPITLTPDVVLTNSMMGVGGVGAVAGGAVGVAHAAHVSGGFLGAIGALSGGGKMAMVGLTLGTAGGVVLGVAAIGGIAVINAGPNICPPEQCNDRCR